jgi:two-component system chemotaxis response regulator CheY
MKRALVVDDSSVMRRMHQKALESLGFEVETAEDGQIALQKLAATADWRLMLTDLHMPNMDGMVLIETVRKDARYAPMKVVMVTSDGVMEVIERAMAVGADDLLIKPFSAAVFAQRMQELLGE